VGGLFSFSPALVFAQNSDASNSLTIIDNDTVEQANVQSSSQTAEIDSDNDLEADASNEDGASSSESGDGSLEGDVSSSQSNDQTAAVANIQVQSSTQEAENVADDDDTISTSQNALSSATGDDSNSDATNTATIEDNDEVEQENEQISEQDADIESDNDIDLDAYNEGGASASESGDGNLEGDVSSSQSNDQTAVVANVQAQISSQDADNEFTDEDDIELSQSADAIADGDGSNVDATNVGSIHDNDLVIQENGQLSLQNADIASDNDIELDASNVGGASASESGDGNLEGNVTSSQSNDQTGLVINAQIQSSEQEAQNDLEDDDIFSIIQSADAIADGNDTNVDATNNATIDDDDGFGQINIQESLQDAEIDSNNSIEADASNVNGSSSSESGLGNLEGDVTSSQSNTQTEAVINFQLQNSDQDAANYADDRDDISVTQSALALASGNDTFVDATNSASLSDGDLVIQGNGQFSNQTADIDSDNDLGSGNSASNIGGASASESGDGNLEGDVTSSQSNDQTKLVINAQIQNSEQEAQNDFEDDDIFSLLQSAAALASEEGSDVDASNAATLDDGDDVGQLNIQEHAQDLDIDSDNTFETDSVNSAGSSSSESGPGSLEGDVTSSESNSQTEATINAQLQFNSQIDNNEFTDEDNINAVQCDTAEDGGITPLQVIACLLTEESG
jgi:hypothetical protein